MVAYLILIPFVLTMLYALFSVNGKNKHVGYVGALAGLATLVFAFISWQDNPGSIAWFSIAGTTAEISLLIDQLAILLAGVVGGIGMFVFLYSVSYFEKGEDLRRYYFFLSLFASSMLGVVLAGNLFQLFFSWELVGISSYFLIGFWHDKPAAVRAARKAIMTIVLGDIFLLGGFILLWLNYGTFDIATILGNLHADKYTLLAGVGIIVGGISKSAQFPLHDWLPDAMEGPTPVSAYLHSATMVKAGLFLIARFLPLLILVGLTPWLLLIAVITIIMSAAMALTEMDIKRVLAYSTMNQLAFILLALGLGAVAAGMFHLLVHSVFKALLFFSAGLAIHTAGTQDLREIRLRPRKDTFTITTVVGVLALAGIVPMAGFFSKEGILEGVLHSGNWAIITVFLLAIIASAGYIFRWLFLLFVKNGRSVHSGWQANLPMGVLAALSLVLGLAVVPFMRVWEEHVPNYLTLSALLSTALALLGAWLAYLVFVRKKEAFLAKSSMVEVFRHRFLVDRVYAALGSGVQRAGNAASVFDDAVINRTSRGIGTLTVRAGDLFKRIQSGHAPTYIALMIIGFIILIFALGVLA